MVGQTNRILCKPCAKTVLMREKLWIEASWLQQVPHIVNKTLENYRQSARSSFTHSFPKSQLRRSAEDMPFARTRFISSDFCFAVLPFHLLRPPFALPGSLIVSTCPHWLHLCFMLFRFSLPDKGDPQDVAEPQCMPAISTDMFRWCIRSRPKMFRDRLPFRLLCISCRLLP
jgi:hypothetical protein